MRHHRAARLLPQILDATLPAATEARVRAHVETCPRCASHLEELRDCEQLVRRLPLALVPLEASWQADARLGALARWAGDAEAPWPERLGLHAVGAFAAAFVLVMALSAGRWDPVVEERFDTSPISIAAVPRIEATPYTWR